jgi:uncharacterized membrane protein
MQIVDPHVRSRARRVIVLLAAVVVLSVADLLVTLVHLRTIGMMEANPVAAFLIRVTESPVSLICFKALTVFICVALLYRLRHHAEGEVAAWCAVVILVALAVMWHDYARRIESPGAVELVMSRDTEHWLVLD